jgi:toxin ParE1/3/4
MRYQVFITHEAEEDLFEIFKYIAMNDAVSKAESLTKKLKKTCESLDELPHHGHVPPELERIGVYDYLEIHYKPYKIIYQVIDTDVYVHCVLDGRRDLQEVLQQRLLR